MTLRPPTVLARATSHDAARVTLPTPLPMVDHTLRLLARPPPALQHMLVSDCHSVPSHNVRPTAATPDADLSPILSPPIVILADPVDAWLLLGLILTVTSPSEYPLVTLPVNMPTVDVKRILPRPPFPALQAMEVSECH